MSRSGYSDCCEDTWASICYRGAVAAAIRGRRGQALLRRLADALDAMPEKRLVAKDLVREDGSCCTLGALARAEGIDVSDLHPEDAEGVAAAFDIAPSLAREIVYENDEMIGPLGDFIVEPARWVAPDGRTFNSWTRWSYEGAQSDLRLRPAVHHPQSAEFTEANERERWSHMRKWVSSNLREPAERTDRGR